MKEVKFPVFHRRELDADDLLRSAWQQLGRQTQKRGHQVLSHPKMLGFCLVGFGIRQNSLVALFLGGRGGYYAAPRSGNFQLQIGCDPF